MAQAPPQAPIVVFALMPAQLNNNILDYATDHDAKIYKNATDKIEVEFNGQGPNIKSFLTRLQNRALNSNWTDICTIADDNGIDRNLFTEHGRITLANIRISAAVYMGQPARDAQNSCQMYNCIINSLSEEALRKVYNESPDYTFNEVPDGPCFLKVLLRTSMVDNQSTDSYLRSCLSSLDKYMTKCDSNIRLFNQYVKDQRSSLMARGGQSEDLLINIFKGYLTCKDASFVEYITKKQDDYDEGVAMTPDDIMQLADNKYQAMILRGTWAAPSKEEMQIVALASEIEEMKKDKEMYKANFTNKIKELNNKYKTGRSKKQNNNDKFAWKKTPPSNNQSTKTHDGKSYHWCVNHLAWTLHSPDECRLENKSNATKVEANCAEFDEDFVDDDNSTL